MRRLFDRFAGWTSEAAGSAPAFTVALAIVVAWLIEGTVISFARHDPGYFLDDKFQLQVNSLTTIITFLLVVLLQRQTNKEGEATQAKLDELIRAVEGADDRLERLEQRPQDEIRRLRDETD